MYHFHYFHFMLLLLCFLFLFIVFFIYRKLRTHRAAQHSSEQSSSAALNSQASLFHETIHQGLMTTGLNYDAKQDLFYAPTDCWQKNYGYCRMFDEACAPMGMILDCEPIPFSHGGTDWLIEFWKGQYQMAVGGEIGFYKQKKRSPFTVEHITGPLYEAVESSDYLHMSFILKKGDRPLFEREGIHWWLNGFQLGTFAEPKELSMEIYITWREKDMCDSFVRALEETGYSSKELHVKSPNLRIDYALPHTPQPITRTGISDQIQLERNEALCELYNVMGADYDNTPDKLLYLLQSTPVFYSQSLMIGKPRILYESVFKGR